MVECAGPGRCIAHQPGQRQPDHLANNLDNAIGLLLTQDPFRLHQRTGPRRRADHRIELNTGHRGTVISGLVNPFFLTWTDAGESGILTRARPGQQGHLIDLSQATAGQQTIANAVPSAPPGLWPPPTGCCCSNSELSQLDLTGLSSPGRELCCWVLVMSPSTASSTATPTPPAINYFFQVKDTPLAATLSIMLTTPAASAEGALLPPLRQRRQRWRNRSRQTWYDYRWSTSTNQFELQTRAASPAATTPCASPTAVGTPLAGQWLNTNGLHNGLCTVRVAFYTATRQRQPDQQPHHAVAPDNSWPIAVIDNILHDGSSVGTCGIVSSGSNKSPSTSSPVTMKGISRAGSSPP